MFEIFRLITMYVQIYDYSAYFEGLRIDEKGEPNASFVHTLLQTIIQAAVFRQDIVNHDCNAECTLSNYIILGHPYCQNLMDAVPRYFITNRFC